MIFYWSKLLEKKFKHLKYISINFNTYWERKIYTTHCVGILEPTQHKNPKWPLKNWTFKKFCNVLHNPDPDLTCWLKPWCAGRVARTRAGRCGGPTASPQSTLTHPGIIINPVLESTRFLRIKCIIYLWNVCMYTPRRIELFFWGFNKKTLKK